MKLLLVIGAILAYVVRIEAGINSLKFDDPKHMAGKAATVHFSLYGESPSSVSCVWYDKLEQPIATCPKAALEPDMSGTYSSTCKLPRQGNMLGDHRVECTTYDANNEAVSVKSKDFSVLMDTSGGIMAPDGGPGNDDHPPSPGPPPGGGPGELPGIAPLDEDDYVPDPGPGPNTWDDDFEQPTMPPGDAPGELPQPAPIPDPGPWVFDDDGPTYPPQVMPEEGPSGPVFSDDIPEPGPIPAPVEPIGDDDMYTAQPTMAPTAAGTETLVFEVTLSDVAKADWDKDTINSNTAFGLTSVAVIAAGDQVTLENVVSYSVKALANANGVARVAVTCTINAAKNPHDGAEGPDEWYERLACDINGGCENFYGGIFSWQLQDEARLVNAKALETANADSVKRITGSGDVAEDNATSPEADSSSNVGESSGSMGTSAIVSIIVGCGAAFALMALAYRMYRASRKASNDLVMEDLGLASRAVPSSRGMEHTSTHNPMAP